MSKYSEMEKLVEAVIGGEGISVLNKLSPEEYQVAWEVLQQLKLGGDCAWLNQLWQLDYDTPPPSFEEFITKPEYFKHVGDDLYPKWKEELLYVLNPMSNVHELVLRGCIGSGKTFIGSLIICYLITRVLHYKNPQRSLGLSNSTDPKTANSPIYFGLISSDLSQLEKMLWNYTLQMMKRSPFFRKRSNIREEKGYKELHLALPKNLHLIGGSLPAHILGLNLLDACMDETNYRRSADPQNEAYDFYLKLRNRVENRFLRTCGQGMIILISSEGDEGAFIDTHCNKLLTEKKEGDSDAHICRFSEWEIKGHTMTLSGEKFKVDIGDKLRPPHVLLDGEEIRQGATVIEAPIEYLKSAKRDLIEFLKERAGVTPGRANKYLYNVTALLESFQLESPALTEVAECALDTTYDIADYFDIKRLLIKVKGQYRPLLRPEMPRFIHIDLAKNDDLAGISMCHVGDYADGGSPIFHQDFCMALKASLNHNIDWDKIIDFIKWLRKNGFFIALVSYDSYQSTHSMNILTKEGFKIKMRSVDVMKTTSRGKVQLEYYEFRTMVSEGRVRLIDHYILKRESVELLDVEGYPDHGEFGSKDVLDATVGSIANAIEMMGGTLGRGDNFGEPASSLTGPGPVGELITEKQLMGDFNRSREDVLIDP